MKLTLTVAAITVLATAAFAGGPGHCYDPSARAGYVCATNECAANGEIAKKDGACAACGQKLAAVKGLTHVAVVLYDGVDLFDVTGPSEVFANAGGFYVYTISESGRAVRAGGMQIEPDYSIENCPWPDVLVVAGRVSRTNELLVNWTELVGKDADYVLKTGGVSSGIDGALNIVAKMKGDDSARRSARAMEYTGWVAQAGGQK